jgi:hypothetical protein
LVDLIKMDLELADGSHHDVTEICRSIFDSTTNRMLRRGDWPRGFPGTSLGTCKLTSEYGAFGDHYQSTGVITDGKIEKDIYLDSHYESLLSEAVFSKPDDLSSAYRNAQPFPSLVVDGLFNEQILGQIVSVFPSMQNMGGRQFDDQYQKKVGTSIDLHERLPAVSLDFLIFLNSDRFRNLLTSICGLENLIPDPLFKGGGLHQCGNGGKLAVHVDFNKLKNHPLLKNMERRLNVIVFLNKKWKDEYNGDLELWSGQSSTPARMISPIFNRTVIFETTAKSYHGHPRPLACPVGITRKSIAAYYYRPENRQDSDFENQPERSTEWLISGN